MVDPATPFRIPGSCMRKVLFLDVDGVLNDFIQLCQFGKDFICIEKLRLLKAIIVATGAQIVLSSAWRKKDHDRQLVTKALALVELSFQECTIDSRYTMPRRGEIQHWLDSHPVDKFAVVDDDPDAAVTKESFFLTKLEVGLTPEIAETIINHLGRRE
jgi:hypothetical protein